MTSSTDIFEMIHSIMHLYRSRQFRGLRDGFLELTHMEFKVLAFFARHPGATLRDLVAHSGRDKAQVARLIQGLRQRELLDGEVDAADKRSTCLRLSGQGRDVFAAVEAQSRRLAELALAGLSADEMSCLDALLGRIRENLGGEH
ncbi:MarR family winged helix-turn-helix transcriptional regulator [Aeromonas dhakensis]|uniref:MarR family winged helix-turn-helix transcriptional regulator n=1 Tax=Aeromonas dhakensis TaxID=196024 RepID=UPI0035715E1B